MNGFDPSSIPPDALSGAIAQLAAHPEIISAVASALGGSPAINEESASKPDSDPSKSTEASASTSEFDLGALMGSIAPVMAALGGKRKKNPSEEHRDALLCALKPYLNEERRRVLEHILRIGQFGDIFKMMK
jgi:hypothetical protein